MSGKSVEYLSLFPRNDENDIENDLINTLLYFFIDFSMNLFTTCIITDKVIECEEGIYKNRE
jgi:hypothetical protein